ncbi:MAG: TRAP transporter substrate-binding protein [Thermoleophilia bacterium]
MIDRKNTARVMMMLLAAALLVAMLATAVGCGGGETTTTTAAAEATTTAASTDTTTAPADEFAGLEPIKLTYAFFAPAGTFPGKQMEEWARLVNERTNGVVTVETFPGGTLLGAQDMYDGVTQGVADIGLGSPSYDPGRFPLTSGVSLPVGFADSTTASLTLWDLYSELTMAEYDGFKVITMFTTEPGYLMTKKSVAGAADLKGMKLRAAGTGVPVLEALGASPIGMPMNEVPEAVQTGLIEGTMTSREVLQDFKLAEQLKFVTNYPTVVVTFAAVMKQDAFDALPAPVQKVIDDLGREMAQWTGNYHDNENVGGALKWSQETQGLQIVELADGQKAEWDAKLQPMVDAWIADMTSKGLDGQGFIDKLYELRDANATK